MRYRHKFRGIFSPRPLIISPFWCLFAPQGFQPESQGSGSPAWIFSNLTWFHVKQKDYRGIPRIKTSSWYLTVARKRDRRRSVENDEITIKFRFTRKGGLDSLLDSTRFARRPSNPQSLPDVHGDFPCFAFPLSRNTHYGRLHWTGRKRTLRGKCLVPMTVGYYSSVHEAKATLFSERAQRVESNGKRGFICRENTLRNEIKYHAIGR